MKHLSNLRTILMLRVAAWTLEVACALARAAARRTSGRGPVDLGRKTMLALAHGLRRFAQWVVLFTPPRER